MSRRNVDASLVTVGVTEDTTCNDYETLDDTREEGVPVSALTTNVDVVYLYRGLDRESPVSFPLL